MRLQILLSAMHLKDESYIDSLNICSDAVVINQCDRSSQKDVQHTCIDGSVHSVRYIETIDRGLSRSRNMAISNADADICILCDNDVEYEEGYENMILSSFEEHPDADIIVFYIKRPERLAPNYPDERRMDYLSVLKIFSPEIAFRRSSFLDLHFDENFGAGAKYFMGEENILLYDALKKKKVIYYVPKKIASLRHEESTWFSGYCKELFITKGAGYGAMSRWFSHVLIWQFALRKTGEYGDKVSFASAVKYMYQGRREYLASRR